MKPCSGDVAAITCPMALPTRGHCVVPTRAEG